MPLQLTQKEKSLEKPFFDLYLNRSSLNIYVQDYYEAWKDLQKAQLLDPSKEISEIRRIEEMSEKVFKLVSCKANIKPKFLEEFLANSKELTVKRDTVELKTVLIDELTEGKQKGICVAGRIVKIISDKLSTVR